MNQQTDPKEPAAPRELEQAAEPDEWYAIDHCRSGCHKIVMSKQRKDFVAGPMLGKDADSIVADHNASHKPAAPSELERIAAIANWHGLTFLTVENGVFIVHVQLPGREHETAQAILGLAEECAKLASQQRGVWIPVSERLPEPNPRNPNNSRRVLVFLPAVFAKHGIDYCYGVGRYWFSSKDWDVGGDPSHWRELLSPPEAALESQAEGK